MKAIDYNKHIWEGWTPQNFIDELEPTIKMIMENSSYIKPFKTKKELKEFCKEHQPYYKKHIPEVVEHFVQKYNLNNKKLK